MFVGINLKVWAQSTFTSMWPCNPLCPAGPRAMELVEKACNPFKELCPGQAKQRQIPPPWEPHSKHEKDYHLCWKAQYVIDVQAYKIQDNNIINYIFLFDGRAGVSTVWEDECVNSCLSSLFPLVVNDRWQHAQVKKRKLKIIKCSRTPPRTHTVRKVKDVKHKYRDVFWQSHF